MENVLACLDGMPPVMNVCRLTMDICATTVAMLLVLLTEHVLLVQLEMELAPTVTLIGLVNNVKNVCPDFMVQIARITVLRVAWPTVLALMELLEMVLVYATLDMEVPSVLLAIMVTMAINVKILV